MYITFLVYTYIYIYICTHVFDIYVYIYIYHFLICIHMHMCVCRDESKMTDLPVDVVNFLVFLQLMCKVGKISPAVIEGHIPSYVFDALSLSSDQ